LAALAREDSIVRNPAIDFRHDGLMRHALVHVPPGWESSESMAVVLAFHGGGGAAAEFREYIRLDAIADREGFIVAYPDGTGPIADRLLTWNAGGCCGYASDKDVDDVGFVLELIEQLGDRYPIDGGRVYATGFSNGAMFTYRLAAEVPARIAAIGPVAGAGAALPAPSGLPVPIIHFHSVDDPRALYDGGLGPPFPLTDRRVEHIAVETVIETWVTHDGCPSSPEVRVRIQAIQNPADAEQGATRIAYRACARGSEVFLWRLTGAGHVWPGAGTLRIQPLLGPPTGIVDANREMWEFFQRHRRGKAPA
jgi:polyhydroxybutyrate depolymerase